MFKRDWRNRLERIEIGEHKLRRRKIDNRKKCGPKVKRSKI